MIKIGVTAHNAVMTCTQNGGHWATDSVCFAVKRPHRLTAHLGALFSHTAKVRIC